MIGKIVGTGSYLPVVIWDNHKIAEFVDTNDEWIRERTGIVKRHIAETEDSVMMAIQSAKRAVEDAMQKGFLNSAEEIDAIFVCSVAPEQVLPAVACEVQKAIGASRAFAWDMNAACSGFVFAYNTAVAYMNLGMIRKALLIGCERLSEITDWKDRGSCILFGDGAGAVIVEATEGQPGMVMHSDGNRGEVLFCDKNTKMQMNGQEVFRFAVKSVPECIEELLGQMNCPKEKIDYFILHQANKRIIEAVAKRLKVSSEKIPMNIENMGNTSSASIPILLDELNHSGKLKTGMRMIMAGFGAGLSWGASYITI